MERKFKRIIAIILTVIMCAGNVIPANAAASDVMNLGKTVDSYQTQDGNFELTTASRFFVVSESEPTGDLLQTVQLAQSQFAADAKPSSTVLDIVWGPESWAKDGDIVVKVDTTSGIAEEGYSINVTGKATVTASDVDGLLYGLNMLHKYFRADGDNTLSGFTASDAPDTKERTVMLDCGRKYFTKEWICNFIREISWMGYNTIELHFSEDGGFRMDFWDPDYYTDNYSPVNDFTWICGSKPQAWVASDYQNDADRGKYLETSEIVEILQTAKQYHLDVIPSFDTPAHVDYLTWQFEQNYLSNKSYSFKYNNETYKASKVSGCINYCNTTGYDDSTYNWPYYSALNIENDVAKAFVFQLYTDIAQFFKEYAGSTKFNIGSDEVALDYSKTWDYSDFPVYVNELDNLLNNLGYTTRIFNDFIGTTNTSYTSGKGVTLSSFNSDIEILYWNSPFNPTNNTYAAEDENKVQPVQNFVDNGRTVYNVIVTNTYFCTRVTSSRSDARDPSNRQWQVYHSNEEDIFNEWYPASVREHGDYSESESTVSDIPGNQLGGAYFCLWHDYASLSTESQIWNGVNSSGKWNVIDRMWSNTIKQWNWDVNSTVTYSEYEVLREAYGEFPGYSSCSSAVTLPTSTSPTRAYLADHSALTKALENKLSNAGYSSESYAAYEEAYTAAEAVNARYDATEAEITAAIEALTNAKEALKSEFTFICKTKVNGKEKEITTLGAAVVGLKFYIYVPPMTGYEFESVSGATYTSLASGDGSGFISGTTDESVVIWYTNVPSTSRLEDVIAETPALDKDSYTTDSWTAYEEALEDANKCVADVSATTHMQSDVDAVTKALTDALTGLVCSSESTSIDEIVKLTPTARLGKQVGLKITTSPDVASITVAVGGVNEELTLCTGRVQTLNSGETVKIWLVDFPADTEGDFTYTVTANGVNGKTEETTVDVTVN